MSRFAELFTYRNDLQKIIDQFEKLNTSVKNSHQEPITTKACMLALIPAIQALATVLQAFEIKINEHEKALKNEPPE